MVGLPQCPSLLTMVYKALCLGLQITLSHKPIVHTVIEYVVKIQNLIILQKFLLSFITLLLISPSNKNEGIKSRKIIILILFVLFKF